MIGLEGVEWKRHRDIARSAFNEANQAFVWRETIRIVNEWFSEIDAAATPTPGQQPTSQVDLLRDMIRATLLVIASAGFGRRSTWLEDTKSTPPPGHKVAFNYAVISAIEQIFPRYLTPKFIWKAVTERGIYVPLIGPVVLKATEAFENLRGHMLEIALQARDRFKQNGIEDENDSVHGAALLRNLVRANMTFEKNEGETGQKSLTDEELFSNMFVSCLFFSASPCIDLRSSSSWQATVCLTLLTGLSSKSGPHQKQPRTHCALPLSILHFTPSTSRECLRKP